MNRPDPNQDQKGRGETDGKTQELLDALKPQKKRPSQVENDEGAPPVQRRRVSSLDEDRLEARRASNRLSAQRARLRQKTVIKEQEMTIRDLEKAKASLQKANHSICMRLDDILHQNQQLKRMMEDEVEIMLGKNRRLQRELERRIGRCAQGLPLEFPTTAVPQLIQRTSTGSSPSYESLRLSQSLFGRGLALSSERITDELSNGNRSPAHPNAVIVDPSDESPSPSPSPARESGLDASSSSANAQDQVPASVQILYLQEEIKTLKKKVQEKFQS